MITQLVTVEVNLRDSAAALQQEIESALARWDYCSGWVVTNADAQQRIVSVTALVVVGIDERIAYKFLQFDTNSVSAG